MKFGRFDVIDSRLATRIGGPPSIVHALATLKMSATGVAGDRGSPASFSLAPLLDQAKNGGSGELLGERADEVDRPRRRAMARGGIAEPVGVEKRAVPPDGDAHCRDDDGSCRSGGTGGVRGGHIGIGCAARHELANQRFDPCPETLLPGEGDPGRRENGSRGGEKQDPLADRHRSLRLVPHAGRVASGSRRRYRE